jgi:hypothetical protein
MMRFLSTKGKSMSEPTKNKTQSGLGTENRKGLSADCTLNKAVVMMILMAGKDHPCDHCNMDRNVCRGYPRL